MIKFFGEKNEYGWLSNFYSSPFKASPLDSEEILTYYTVEHYFQCAKFRFPGASEKSVEYSEIIRKEKSPSKAKLLANQKNLGGYKWKTDLNPTIKKYRDEYGVKIMGGKCDWDDLRDTVMYLGLLHKFRNPGLRKKLAETGDALLIENSPYDYYWGVGKDGSGKNKLGKLLMKVRDRLI